MPDRSCCCPTTASLTCCSSFRAADRVHADHHEGVVRERPGRLHPGLTAFPRPRGEDREHLDRAASSGLFREGRGFDLDGDGSGEATALATDVNISALTTPSRANVCPCSSTEWRAIPGRLLLAARFSPTLHHRSYPLSAGSTGRRLFDTCSVRPVEICSGWLLGRVLRGHGIRRREPGASELGPDQVDTTGSACWRHPFLVRRRRFWARGNTVTQRRGPFMVHRR